MDIVLLILGIICLLTGLIGSVVPMLPGPPISYVGMLLLQWSGYVHFTVNQFIIWLIIVIIVQLLDYFMPMFGAKRYGGSKWGNWGCVIGTFVGIFIFPPWGIILGPFLGAFIGELLGGKKSSAAFKAGFGAFVGFLFGTITKLIVCGVFIFYFLVDVF